MCHAKWFGGSVATRFCCNIAVYGGSAWTNTAVGLLRWRETSLSLLKRTESVMRKKISDIDEQNKIFDASGKMKCRSSNYLVKPILQTVFKCSHLRWKKTTYDCNWHFYYNPNESKTLENNWKRATSQVFTIVHCFIVYTFYQTQIGRYIFKYI